MISVSYIQNFAQRISNNLSDILGLDVTIIDRDGIRISGTGNYKGLIGQRVPEQSFFEKIIENGEAGVIIRKESEENCRGCVFLDRCKELATIGFPIKKNTEPLGVIGLVGFSTLQKEIIIENRDIIMKFLNIISDLIETEILVLEKEELKDCSILKRKENNSITSFNSIVGQNRKFLDVIKKSRKVSNSISTVLVRGESGTGKEILAQAIHNESDRRNYPFVAVNCATIPENLVESELFGYEGGAFTGSKREGKPGKFELAHPEFDSKTQK